MQMGGKRGVLCDELLALGRGLDFGLAQAEDVRLTLDVGAKPGNRPEQLRRQIRVDV